MAIALPYGRGCFTTAARYCQDQTRAVGVSPPRGERSINRPVATPSTRVCSVREAGVFDNRKASSYKSFGSRSPLFCDSSTPGVLELWVCTSRIFLAETFPGEQREP
jgi:hypothetical protein